MLKRTLLLALISSSPAFATKTQFFRHGNAAEFETGKLDAVVATNFGELKLARAVETVLADDGSFASIDTLAESPDGTIYAGTTASGKLLAIKGGKSTEVADFGEAASVAALSFNAAGDLLIGVGGDNAELQILRKGATKPERVTKLDGDATYIWGLAITSDGKVYLATGPNGQLFEVDLATKKSRVVYDSDEDNLRAIVALNDTLFVGTDPHGLILKIDRSTGKAFVVYDAPETEISTLLLDSQSGQIYAGTSQLVEATEPAAPDATDATATGRPHADDGKGHITLDPAEPPKPSKPGENEPAGTLPTGDAAMPKTAGTRTDVAARR